MESFIEFIEANATNKVKPDASVSGGAEQVVFGDADSGSRGRDEL
jgi:hypothetical protein